MMRDRTLTATAALPPARRCPGESTPAGIQARLGPVTAQDPAAQDSAAQDSAAQDPAAQDPAAQDPAAQARVADGRTRLTHLDWIIAGLIAVAALAARWPLLGEGLLHKDEAIVGLMAQDIAEGVRFPLYFYGQSYMGALEAYAVAAWLLVVQDPITALRLGPACFLALLAGLQYLMLTRWLGRSAGLIGAGVVIAAAPMFAMWSVAARGAYIEVLVWGTALWWAYSEWFAPDRRRLPNFATGRAQLMLGLLVGSGLWLNATIVVFVAGMAIHYCLGAVLPAWEQDRAWGPRLRRWQRLGGALPCALPVAGLLAVIAASAVFSLEVTLGGIRRRLLFGAIPERWALSVLIAVAVAGCAFVLLRTRWPAQVLTGIRRVAPLILGVCAGSLPSAAYVVQRRFAGLPLEDALPFGLRPPWTIGETLQFLGSGLGLLVGADPTGLATLWFMGRAPFVWPEWAAVLPALNLAVGAGLVICCAVLVMNQRRWFVDLLRARSGLYPLWMLPVLGLAVLFGLYLLSGFTFDLTSIRYLVPMWAMLAGVLAAAALGPRGRGIVRPCLAGVAVAWAAGQLALSLPAGATHTHRRLAEELERRGVCVAVAEVEDAHFISYLSGQRVRVLEFEPFWPRLMHYSGLLDTTGADAVHYIVQDGRRDHLQAWAATGWPGPGPVEMHQRLRQRLEHLTAVHPAAVQERVDIVDGYELWSLNGSLEALERAANRTEQPQPDALQSTAWPPNAVNDDQRQRLRLQGTCHSRTKNLESGFAE